MAGLERKYGIIKLLYEINDPWFQDICLEADVDPDRIYKVTKNLFKSYNYDQMLWGQVPNRFDRYKINKEKKKLLAEKFKIE